MQDACWAGYPIHRQVNVKPFTHIWNPHYQAPHVKGLPTPVCKTLGLLISTLQEMLGCVQSVLTVNLRMLQSLSTKRRHRPGRRLVIKAHAPHANPMGGSRGD
jgi:hypothetical protein